MRFTYKWQHWDGCFCEACDAIFSSHNPDRNGPICSCSGCRTRDAALKANRNTTSNYNNQGKVKTVATVNFCERCNTMGKSNVMGGLQYWNSPNDNMSGPKEICPGCVNDFHSFMKGEAVTATADATRPQSYTEPWTAHKNDPLAGLSDDEIARAYLARVAARESVNELTDGSDGTL